MSWQEMMAAKAAIAAHGRCNENCGKPNQVIEHNAAVRARVHLLWQWRIDRNFGVGPFVWAVA